MNLHQVLNSGAFFFVIAALLAGMGPTREVEYEDALDFLSVNKEIVLFSVFYVVLRMKITFDDHQYFGSREVDEGGSKEAGFYVAVLSWVACALSGFSVQNFKVSAGFLAISIAASTVWCVIHFISASFRFFGHSGGEVEKRVLKEVVRMRLIWGGANVLYIVLLFASSCYESFRVFSLFSCLLVLFVDIGISKSFKEK